MANRFFNFEVYRINLVQAEPGLFEEMNQPISSDQDITTIVKHAVTPDYKALFSGPKNTFEWVLRDFFSLFPESETSGEFYQLTIAKSVVETSGEIVTDSGIESGVSEAEPPLADTCRLFFYMKRHLLVIEKRSAITNSRWRSALEFILKHAAQDLQYSGWMEFEPVPRYEEIIEAFHSFERLTRLRVILRLPNPELSRYSESLFNQMEASSIREYFQEMKNPRGLSTEKGKLPHATTEIAAAGYKKGEVTFEGHRQGRRDVVKTGNAAAQGTVNELRDYVRGLKDMAKTKEGQRVTSAIIAEIDRIAPPPQKAEKQ